MTERGGYFQNGIKHRRDELNREHRLLVARLETLRRTGHPCADDQEALVALNRDMLATVNRHALGENEQPKER